VLRHPLRPADRGGQVAGEHPLDQFHDPCTGTVLGYRVGVLSQPRHGGRDAL